MTLVQQRYGMVSTGQIGSGNGRPDCPSTRWLSSRHANCYLMTRERERERDWVQTGSTKRNWLSVSVHACNSSLYTISSAQLFMSSDHRTFQVLEFLIPSQSTSILRGWHNNLETSTHHDHHIVFECSTYYRLMWSKC